MPDESEDKRNFLPKVKPRGKALKRTAAQLDAMTSPDALVTLVDEAKADWRENVPRGYKMLLDSKLEKP